MVILENKKLQYFKQKSCPKIFNSSGIYLFAIIASQFLFQNSIDNKTGENNGIKNIILDI